MNQHEPSTSLLDRASAITRRLGRTRVRTGIGLLLAAVIAIPGGVALADNKIAPPDPVVSKMAPPAPEVPDVTEAPSPEASVDPAPATEPQLPDPADTAPEGAVPQDQTAPQPVDPPTDPQVAKDVAAEPTTSSAKELSAPGESLTAVDETGLDQSGATKPAAQADPGDETTATGDIAVAGEKDETSADYVIVGLSAPLDTAGADVHVVGASWDALPASVSVKVELRELIKGRWSDWSGLEVATNDSQDPGASRRQTTEPYVSSAASDLQVRLLTSDGSVPKNARVDLVGDDVTKKDTVAAAAGKDATTAIPATPSQTNTDPAAGTGATATPQPSGVVPSSAAPASTSLDAAIVQSAFTETSQGDGTISADTGEFTPTDSADQSGDGQDGEDVIAEPVAARSISQPVIKSRAAWGAAKPRDDWSKGKVTGMVIHHTAGSNNYTRAQVPAILRSIQLYHQRTLGWNDIGYNFLIDKFGTIWEGRAGGVTQPIAGAHALYMNYTTSGVSVIGDYSKAAPSSAVLNSLAKLVAWKLGVHGVNPWGTMVNRNKRTPTVIGHRDAPGNSTACPGQAFYNKLGWLRTKVRDLTPAGFVFNGKGSGAGAGLSLYGAQQLAGSTWGAAKILQYYLPGTKTTGSWSNPTLRVQLVKTGSATTIKAKTGSMRLVVGSKRYTAKSITFSMRKKVLYAKVAKRTFKAPRGGFQVQWTGTRAWKGKAGLVQVQRAASNSGWVTYRWGRILVSNISGKINVVNEVKLNSEYLYGAVPMSSRWRPAAMQSAIIATRTYALKAYKDLKGKTRADCNCQLYDDSGITYRGWSKAGEKTWGVKWQAAVNATRTRSGYQILTYRGAPAVINFTSSTGGKTQYRQDAFGGKALPYFQPRGDTYSLTKANPYRSWRVTLTPGQVAVRLKMPNVVELTVLKRASSGAVIGLRARASNGVTKVIQGNTEAVRKALGLRSAYFTIGRS